MRAGRIDEVDRIVGNQPSARSGCKRQPSDPRIRQGEQHRIPATHREVPFRVEGPGADHPSSRRNLALELSVAFLSWQKSTLILILIGLALWKALLVALYYMHLRYEHNRLRLLALAPLPFTVILVVAVLQERLR